MTEALFFCDTAGIAEAQVGDVVELDGAEGRHAVTVKRVRSGERISLGDGAGVVLSCVVIDRQPPARLTARVETRAFRAAPTPAVVVFQALAKSDRGELAVEMLTEVGVDEIVSWAAARSVVKWTQEKADRGVARWASVAHAAAKQSRRARFPQVSPLASTRDVLTRINGLDLAIVLHESATENLADLRLADLGSVGLIVGPEGGISNEEITAFRSAGARVCLLGPDVLRTSTAGTAAASVIMARSGRWSATPAGRIHS